MAKLQRYNALCNKAWLFGILGIVLGAMVVSYATFVGSTSMAVSVAISAAVAWMAVVFGVASIVLCLIAIHFKIASVKLMRQIVDERKLLEK